MRDPVWSPQQFRKKPVVIEAIQWDGSEESQRAVVNWAAGAVAGFFDSAYFLQISTREGDMRADPGDRVIKGVKGEFYPCKRDIFAATYEPALAASGPSQPEPSRRCQSSEECDGRCGA